jgi:hypothetical protein
MYSYKIGTHNELHLCIWTLKMHSVFLKDRINFNFNAENGNIEIKH